MSARPARSRMATLCLMLLCLCQLSVIVGTYTDDAVQHPFLPPSESSAGLEFAGFAPIQEANAQAGHIFYWLTGAKNVTVEKALGEFPLVVVLEGGPGFSSILQAVGGCGPYRLSVLNSSSAEPSVVRHDFTWNTFANLLFFDSPLGVGYSSVDPGLNFSTVSPSTEAGVAGDLHQALEHVLSLHPVLRRVPIYVFGHSYGGRYGPALTAYLLRNAPKLDVQGLIVGNGLFDIRTQVPAIPSFLRALGLSSRDQFESVQAQAELVVDLIDKRDFAEAADIFYGMSQITAPLFIDQYSVTCVTTKCFLKQSAATLAGTFFNRTAVKVRLNVPASQDFYFFGRTNLDGDRALSSQPDMEYVLSRNVKVLAYNGNLDGFLPIDGVKEFLRGLNYSYATEFAEAAPKPWGVVQLPVIDIKGSVLADKHGLLTSVAVYDSGHFANAEQGHSTQQLVEYFVQGKPLPRPDTPTLLR